MLSKKKELGTTLREKRKEMHLSLKEVENAISIKMLYLQAIEEGYVDKLISSTYAIGFITQYANFLGFNGERIIKENNITTKCEKPNYLNFELGIFRQRNDLKKKYFSIKNIIWTISSISIILLTLYYFKTHEL